MLTSKLSGHLQAPRQYGTCCLGLADIRIQGLGVSGFRGSGVWVLGLGV